MFQSLFHISDTALNVLILKIFNVPKNFSILKTLISFTKRLPFNLHSAWKAIDTKNVGFQRYISCTTCRSIYNWDECTVRLQSGELQSKRCTFILFPNHPRVQHQKPCDTVLMKTMKCSGGKTVLYPRMIFTYKSLIDLDFLRSVNCGDLSLIKMKYTLICMRVTFGKNFKTQMVLHSYLYVIVFHFK